MGPTAAGPRGQMIAFPAAVRVWSAGGVTDIDPLAWLADVLARLPNTTASRVNDLLPWTWQPSERQRAA